MESSQTLRRMTVSERDPLEVRPLSRDDLCDGSALQTFVRARIPYAWTDAQIEGSLAATMAKAPPGDIWLFAYGSLIWNPLIPVAEERVAMVHGLHRSFCIWSELGRGSPGRPGLVLGLDRGGRCQGVVLRLERHHALAELRMVWRREMVTGAYRPTWIKARTPEGTVIAIAFAVERRNQAYAGRLDEDRVVGVLETAGGFLGPCRDYLAQTIAGLATRGIREPVLQRLAMRCGLSTAASGDRVDHAAVDA
jgi:glutathione-specific gamma-glutamylcyclotransferase